MLLWSHHIVLYFRHAFDVGSVWAYISIISIMYIANNQVWDKC